MEDKETIYRDMYQHLCDAQDVCERLHMPSLYPIYDDIVNLRHKADALFYNTFNQSNEDEK